MAVDKLRFAGSHDAPTRLTDVFSRRPILGSGERPDALLALARQQSIFVRAEGGEEPQLEIQRVEEVDAQLWRVDLEVSERQWPTFVPGKTLRRERPEFFLEQIDESISVAGFRPSWADVLFAPRPSPQRQLRSMRRLNGRHLEPYEVFGSDDRQEFRDASRPWGLTGKIFASDGYVGSGVLVGDRLVVTAGHLVPWSQVSGSWWMRFVPAYFDGVSLHGSGIESYVSDVRGYDTSGDVAGYDWAILRLYEPLGQSLGYFGYNGYSSDWNDEPYWSIVGYPGAIASGRRPSYQNSITIFDVDSDSNGGQELESQTADTSPGNSGGPMFAWWGSDPRVVGVVSGAESDWIFPFSSERANVIAGGSGFSNLIAWRRSNWPA